MKKRLLTIILSVLVIASTLTGCGYVQVSSTNLTTINVGYMANYGSLWSVLNAIELGYMEKEGFKVNLVEYSDGPKIIAALQDGTIDVGYIGNGAHVECINGNAKIFAISHISNADALIATAEIGSVKDLEGKMIAYEGDTSSEAILARALAKEGMSMLDIIPVDLPQNQVVDAFTRGDVVAAAIWSPYSLDILEQVEGAKVLANNMTFDNETVALSSWVAANDTVKNDRYKLVRFTRALYKAMDEAANENQEQTAAWVAEQVGQEQDSVYAQRGDAKWLTGKEIASGLESGSIQEYYELQRKGFVEAGLVSEATYIDDYVDFDIMTEAGYY